MLIPIKNLFHKYSCKYALKKIKIINTINEELELDNVDDKYDKFDEYQHIYDGLH